MDTTEQTSSAGDSITTPTWALTPTEYASTVERVAKINARAIKRGFTGRFAVTGFEREVVERDRAGLSVTRLVVDTVISGEAPCYNGWEFLAAVDTVETKDGAAYVLRAAPGIEITTFDRSILLPGQCQHCKTIRKNRIYTYLVRNTDTGETVQVGSTCIKDFTGWAGKPVFISIDELADELDRMGFSGAPEFTVETVVAVAYGISRVFGWVPTSASYEGRPATRDLAEAYLYGVGKADNELRAEVGPAVAEHQSLAGTIVATLLGELSDDGGYGSNMLAVLRAASVIPRHMGLVVSAVAAYERVIGERVKREVTESAARETEFAGVVGEKITVTGRVTRLLPVENNYGYQTTTSMLVILEDGQTVAKMFTAAQWAFDVKQGEEITITATVKEHEEYRGAKQTVLARPKRVVPTPAASTPKEPMTIQTHFSEFSKEFKTVIASHDSTSSAKAAEYKPRTAAARALRLLAGLPETSRASVSVFWLNQGDGDGQVPDETIEVQIGKNRVLLLENDLPKDRLLTRMSYVDVDVQEAADKVQAAIDASDHAVVHAEVLLDTGEVRDVQLDSPIGTGNTARCRPGDAGIVVVDVRLPEWFLG